MENIQDDFEIMQGNFKKIVSEEHKNFDTLTAGNRNLVKAVNQLKLQEISDKYSALNTRLEIDLLHKVQMLTSRVENLAYTLQDTISTISQILLTQRAGSGDLCLNNRIVQGCVNPSQSRLILRNPKVLDLRLNHIHLAQKKFISCDVTQDPEKVYVFNNKEVGLGSTFPHLCLERRSTGADFFIRTASHHVNVLINDRELKISCAPTAEVVVNGKNVTCQQQSAKNPSFHALHSFRIDDKEFIAESVTNYKFLARILEDRREVEDQLHYLDPHLVKTGPLEFFTKPLKNLGRRIGIHHSVLLQILVWALWILFMVAIVIGLVLLSRFCRTLSKFECPGREWIDRIMNCFKKTETPNPLSEAIRPLQTPIVRPQSAGPTETTSFLPTQASYSQEASPPASPEKPPPAYFAEVVNTPVRVPLNHAAPRGGTHPAAPLVPPGNQSQVYPNMSI